jgi:hypothetical protein
VTGGSDRPDLSRLIATVLREHDGTVRVLHNDSRSYVPDVEPISEVVYAAGRT